MRRRRRAACTDTYSHCTPSLLATASMCARMQRMHACPRLPAAALLSLYPFLARLALVTQLPSGLPASSCSSCLRMPACPATSSMCEESKLRAMGNAHTGAMARLSAGDQAGVARQLPRSHFWSAGGPGPCERGLLHCGDRGMMRVGIVDVPQLPCRCRDS